VPPLPPALERRPQAQLTVLEAEEVARQPWQLVVAAVAERRA